MKERSRERMAALLMEELVDQLAARESVKKMLADMTTGMPVDKLIEKLLDEFEQILGKHHQEMLAQKAAREAVPEPARKEQSEYTLKLFPPIPQHIPAAPKIEETKETTEQSTPAEKPARVVPPPAPKRPPARPEPPPAVEDEEIREFRRRMEELERDSELSRTRAGQSPHGPDDVTVSPLPKKEEKPGRVPSLESTDEESFQRSRYNFEDSDQVYIHAVAKIPEDDVASDYPFMLEEKGIDGRQFAFGYDYKDLRFYLSRINPAEMMVSTKGLLLLGKQESLQALGAHASILNDLRVHGPLLPFEFGSVAQGRDALLGKIEESYDRLVESLEELLATRWWTVALHVLDARIAQLFGPEPSPGVRREREVKRASYSSIVQPKVLDIKTLERVLNKEKKIAESVHDELKKVARRADVEMIVTLGSGSSEDWKQIMKVSYEVPPEDLLRFNRAVTDLQYHHILFDLMILVTGERESFAFPQE